MTIITIKERTAPVACRNKSKKERQKEKCTQRTKTRMRAQTHEELNYWKWQREMMSNDDVIFRIYESE